MTLLLLALLAASPTPQRLSLLSAKMSISGTSNLHDWSCDVPQPQPKIDVQPADTPTGLLPSAVALEVPVGAITCGNGTMEGKLRDALDVKHHPNIEFTLASARSLNRGDKVLARGHLKIAAVGRDIAFVARIQQAGTRVEVAGDVPVQMSDYQVTPPTALMGMLTTGNQVVVHFTLVFDAPKSPGRPAEPHAAP